MRRLLIRDRDHRGPHSNSAGRPHLWVRQCVTSRPNRSGVYRRHVVDQSVWPSKEIISARTMASPELIVLGKLAGFPPVMPGERHAAQSGCAAVRQRLSYLSPTEGAPAAAPLTGWYRRRRDFVRRAL